MNHQHLHSIRKFELGRVLCDFSSIPHNGRAVRVLELGAGTGYQASLIKQLGYEVIAIDVPGSAYANSRVHPIIEYDGCTLPFTTGSIDVVFSSNVLEHIVSIEKLLYEIKRVLSPDGKSIHILPTPAWRMWTILSYFGWAAKRVSALLLKGVFGGQIVCGKTICDNCTKSFSAIASQLWPRRHGERGNSFKEIRLFSAECWRRIFIANGFEIKKDYSIGLFYTGSMFFAEWLPLANRISMAKLLGSASRAYVITPIEVDKTKNKNETKLG